MAIYIVKAKKTSLKSPLGINATSAILKNLVDSHGNALAMSSFGDWGVMVVKNATKVEMIKFTGITQNSDSSATITFATNGRRMLPIYPYTGSATGTDPFQTASEVIITNDPLTMSSFGNLNNAQTWSLLQTFLVAPKSSSAPVASDDLVNKAYADGLALGGATVDKLVVAGNAGETISGAGKLIYFDTTDNEWKLCDADNASTVDDVMLGISQGAGTNGNAITGGVLIRGVDTNQSGRTIGDIQYASNTAGGISNSAGTTLKIIGIAQSATSIYFDPYFGRQVSSTFPTSFVSSSAGAGDAGKGAVLNANGKFDPSFTTAPTVQKYVWGDRVGSGTTQFVITNPSGSTFRYTYNGLGTDPVINSTTFPVGSTVKVELTGGGIIPANSGQFTVTGSGSNYFEVTNASGVATGATTVGNGGVYVLLASYLTWTKPSNLKYVIAEVVGGGGGSGGAGTGGSTNDETGGGGGGGGYSKKLIPASSLGATEVIAVGAGGRFSTSSGTGGTGGTSSFGSHLSATGGAGGTAGGAGGAGGVGSNGDININGSAGGGGVGDTSSDNGNPSGGVGGSSFYGGGAVGSTGSGVDGVAGLKYGGGASGGSTTGNSQTALGAQGGFGIVIVTEYYN